MEDIRTAAAALPPDPKRAASVADALERHKARRAAAARKRLFKADYAAGDKGKQ